MLDKRATIEIDERDRQAVDPDRGLPERFEVQFNPGEYSLSKGSQYSEIDIPGIDSPLLQFVRGQNERLTLDLFFDTTDDGMGDDVTDVRERTRSIYQLVKQQPKTHAPPRITFTWGSLSFRAVVESVRQRFTLFNPQGVPLRATLSVTFREYRELKELLKDLESPDHSKQRVVRRGETLSSIAAEEYRNPALWRVIADHPANAGMIGNPRRLAPGAVLEIPPLDPSAAGSEVPR
jgi:hypothetical protein